VKNDIRDSLLSVQQDEITGEITAEYCFSPELEVFSGHFPGNPILPGVFQIEMIRYALETILHDNYIIKVTSKAKFTSIILPDSKITIRIKTTDIDGGIKLRAKSYVDQKMTSDVSLVFSSADHNSAN
jgi:3-hydroxyacyl-[acyl-carrier-protein] dehydratase